MESIILLLGLLVAAAGAYLFHRTIVLLRDGVRTQGTIVDVRRRHSSDSYKTMNTPIVRFTDTAGRDVVFASSMSSTGSQYFVGRNVGVLYREARPDAAQIDGLFALWGAPVICAIIGVVFVYAGLFGTAI